MTLTAKNMQELQIQKKAGDDHAGFFFLPASHFLLDVFKLMHVTNCTSRPLLSLWVFKCPCGAISLVDIYVWIKTNTGWWEQEQSAGSAGVCWASAAAAAVTDTCTASSRI